MVSSDVALFTKGSKSPSATDSYLSVTDKPEISANGSSSDSSGLDSALFPSFAYDQISSLLTLSSRNFEGLKR